MHPYQSRMCLNQGKPRSSLRNRPHINHACYRSPLQSISPNFAPFRPAWMGQARQDKMRLLLAKTMLRSREK